MERYSVTELATGRSRGNRSDMICILADVRNRSKPASLQIWCAAKQKVISLPRSVIRVQTHDARRWLAISVPRWLVDKEQLWTEPEHPPVVDENKSMNMRTMEMMRDDQDVRIAKYVVDRENKYTQKPGQRMSVGAYGGAA